MTVKDVFDLRRQDRIEEAYDAIRPMYAAHKGRYTTLCMFWTASDIFKKRLDEDRINEAARILEALKRMQPRVEEINKELDSQAATPAASVSKLPWENNEKQQSGTSAAAFVASASRRLAKALKAQSSRSDSKSSRNKSSQEEISAISALSARQETSLLGDHSSDSCSKEEAQSDNISALSALSARQINSAGQETSPSGDNSSDSCSKEESQSDNISALSALSARQINSAGQETSPLGGHSSDSSDSCSKAKAPTSSNEDLADHLIVILDEGIIRPIEGINAPQRVVLACLVAHPGYNVPQISTSTGIPAKNIERHVAALIERGLIEHRGSKKTGGYYAK